MWRVVGKRILTAIPLLIGVSIIAFVLLRLAPGDPVLLHADPDASPEQIEAERERLHLNDPLYIQYFIWAGDVLRGNFGTSINSNMPALQLILEKVPTTLQLALSALILIVIIGIPLGILSAVKKGKVADQIIRVFSLVGVSLPAFVVGLGFVFIVGWVLKGVWPYQGLVSPFDDPLLSLQTTLLPALAIAIPDIGMIARLTRASFLEVYESDYVTAARSFGVPEGQVLFKDTLRNAMLPVITVLGIITGHLLGGSVVVESIFAIDGVGRLLVNSFGQLDYAVTIGVLLLIAAIVVITNIVVDLMYSIVDPRVRFAASDRNK